MNGQAWPPEFADRVKAFINDRTALATAIMATGEQGRVGLPAGPGRPMIARYHRATGEMTWFQTDERYVWWCVRRESTTEYWRTARAIGLLAALCELIERLADLKRDAEAVGLQWPSLVRRSSFGSEYWTSSQAPEGRT
jgi:hypothetical protein